MMKNVLAVIFGLTLTCGVIYGMYWVAKTVSYTIFYEDMVEDTIREMVKPEYLIDGLRQQSTTNDLLYVN